jgi:hypothetical protein
MHANLCLCVQRTEESLLNECAIVCRLFPEAKRCFPINAGNGHTIHMSIHKKRAPRKLINLVRLIWFSWANKLNFAPLKINDPKLVKAFLETFQLLQKTKDRSHSRQGGNLQIGVVFGLLSVPTRWPKFGIGTRLQWIERDKSSKTSVFCCKG